MRASLQLGLASLVAVLSAASAAAQSQPLGDVARQQQLQKQQSPTAQKVITNEDIPGATADVVGSSSAATEKSEDARSSKKSSAQPDASAVRAKISAQKQKVKELEAKIVADQKQIAKHNAIGTVEVYESGNLLHTGALSGECNYPDYVQEQRGYKDWCDEPAKLQAEIDDLQKQHDTERATLEAMQEEARQQGFGNSVYDPD